MSKVVATYWDNSQTVWTKPHTASMPKNNRVNTVTPQWVIFAVIASVTCLLCLTINFRAFSEMRQEIDQHQTLTSQTEILTTENLSLQE